MIPRLFLGAGLAAVAVSTAAAEFGHALRAGATYSDNVLRSTAGNEIDSGTMFLGLQVFNSRPVGRLRYDVSVDLGYYEYLEVDVDQNLQGRAMLDGTYDIIPETFSWNAQVEYDQIRQDLLRPVAPDNVEGVQRYSTGPSLYARLSPQTQAVLTGRYSFVNYGKRDNDNETLGGRFEIRHQPSSRTSVGPGISYDHITYPSDPGLGSSDFDRQEAFLRVDYNSPRSKLGAEFGYAQFKFADSKDDGPMLRGQFSRQLTPSLEAFVRAAREYTVTNGYGGYGYGGYGVPPYSDGGPYDNSILTAAPRISVSLDLGLRFDRARTGGELVWGKRKEDATLAGSGTRRYDEWRGRLTRRMTPRLRGALYGVWMDDDLPASVTASASGSKEHTLGASLDFTFGRATGVGVWIEDRSRSGSGAYSEISGGLFLTWGKRYAREGAQ